jgi:dsDNA-specific endonuclease/ATPase MutS2
VSGRDPDGGEPDDLDPVEVPIEDWIDLHPFRPRDIPGVVEAYLEAAVERGFEEVRIVHGKGIGFQREVVRKILDRHPEVRSFVQAPPERGGWGATVVRLHAR